MAGSTGLLRSSTPTILAHLRTLRESLQQARDLLLHFSGDRLDRDKLEPAARRVDDLMNLYTSHTRDPEQGAIWVAEILAGVEQVTNPKAATALREARAVIAVLLDLVSARAAPQAPRI